MTNFEKIKSLNIVDLATVLENVHDEFITSAQDYFGGEIFCYGFASLLKWLEQDYNKYDDVWRYIKQSDLEKATSLLKQCVNYDNDSMRTGIGGELGEEIREFIGRCGE